MKKINMISKLLEDPDSHISRGTSKEAILHTLELAPPEFKKKSGVLYYPACGHDLLPIFMFNSIEKFVYVNNERIYAPLLLLYELFNTPLDDKKPVEEREYVINCLRITPPLYNITRDTSEFDTSATEYTATFRLYGKPKILKAYKRKVHEGADHPEEVTRGIDVYYSEFPRTEKEFLELGVLSFLKKDALIFTQFKPNNKGVKYKGMLGPCGKNHFSMKL